MQEFADAPLAQWSTLGLGGPGRRVVVAQTEAEVLDVVRAADAAGDALLLIAGGSNLVLPDEGFDGTVLIVANRGIGPAVPREDGTVAVTVQAGEWWDAFVAHSVANGWSGNECLSGIPGSTGATPIQNVGAYGQEVAETIESVRAWDRDLGEIRTFPAADCGFAYRTSIFKYHLRWVVLDVTFRLTVSDRSRPIRYSELARTLGVEVGATAPLAQARDTVLTLRRRKGMVIDPSDPDTRSVGSFFTNPVLSQDEYDALLVRSAARLGPDAPPPPAFPGGAGRVKTSAAWLIERAGFTKGYGPGPVRLSTKHTLALTHPGGGSTRELLALARDVRDGVQAAFGVTLHPEPVILADFEGKD